MRTVNELKAEINRLTGEIMSINANKINSNIGKFAEEVLNLLQGVGEGYIPEDYYAQTRYDSKIQGVKNIRINNYNRDTPTIIVKVYSPSGYLLPRELNLDEGCFNVEFIQSSHYCDKIDY